MRPVLALLVVLAASPAEAAVGVAWDCFLSSGPVTCTSLETTFFSNKAYERADAEHALAHVEVRAISIAAATQYDFVFTSGAQVFQYSDAVPQEFSPDAVLLRIVGDIEKCTAPLFVVDEPASVDDDGIMKLSLRDPTLAMRKARSDDETTGWYISPSLSIGGDQHGVLEVSGNGSLEINYSNPLIRVHGTNWGGYRYAHTDDVVTFPKASDRTYENFDWGTYWILARTIWKGLSIAGEGQLEVAPEQNEAFRANTYAGIEWVLNPFLKTDEGNVGVQYVMGAEYYDFVVENVQLKRELYWLRHRLTLSGTWHFPVVDVNGSVTYAGMVNDLHFSAFSGSAGLTWHLLDDLSLSAGGDVSYRLGLVEEPKDTSQLPPLAQFYGGSAYGQVTFDFGLSLQYVFGNSLLLHEDQRWKG